MEKKREFDNSFMEINETIDDAETEIVSDTDTVSVDFTEYAEETNDETSKKPENNDAASEPEEEPVNIDTTNAAALYTLWFGLDYGSILTAYALYKTVEESGKKPYLIGKPDVLWGEHYADKENIAGKFIYKNCDVVQIGNGKAVKETLDAVNTHIVGSDILWDEKVVGKQAGKYYYLSEVDNNTNKIAFGTSVGADYNIPVDKRNDYSILLHKFSNISVKSFSESLTMADMYYIQPELVIDPVFLCDSDDYKKCAEKSVAREVEKENSFIFTYIKNGDARKRDLVLRGNRILMEKYVSPLRNFIDINRYPESKAAIGLDPAYHILVEDWLHYIINSNFVITDDYYGMCFAILFNKNFVIIGNREMKDISRYDTLLEQLDLKERMVFIDDDFKTKEYLFRKPVRYNIVNEKLEKLKSDSLEWLRNSIQLSK